jgi:hypothetical protein
VTSVDEKKDSAVYHSILAEMHRLRALLLNMQTIDLGATEEGIRAHLTREQGLVLGKLTEWRQHRPLIYRRAEEDFQRLYPPSNEAQSPRSGAQ